MGEQTEGIGISLKVDDVAPELRIQFALQFSTCPLGEESLYRLLAAMAERRIAQIVSQTGGSHNLPDLLKERILQFGMLYDEFLGDVVAQRHADTCYLERVGQTVMHEDASRQGEYLGLVLKPTEGSGENQAVIVAFELRSVVVALGVAMLLSETLI